MLNQSKMKKSFFPKLGLFNPDHPLLLNYKHLQPLSQLKHHSSIAKQILTPKKQHPNLNSQNCKYSYQPHRLINHKELSLERYSINSARQSVTTGKDSHNKQNSNDIFIKRDKLYSINRKSLHYRMGQQSEKRSMNDAIVIKPTVMKKNRLREIRERPIQSNKQNLKQQLTGWHHFQDDSYCKILGEL